MERLSDSIDARAWYGSTLAKLSLLEDERERRRYRRHFRGTADVDRTRRYGATSSPGGGIPGWGTGAEPPGSGIDQGGNVDTSGDFESAPVDTGSPGSPFIAPEGDKVKPTKIGPQGVKSIGGRSVLFPASSVAATAASTIASAALDGYRCECARCRGNRGRR